MEKANGNKHEEDFGSLGKSTVAYDSEEIDRVPLVCIETIELCKPQRSVFTVPAVADSNDTTSVDVTVPKEGGKGDLHSRELQSKESKSRIELLFRRE